MTTRPRRSPAALAGLAGLALLSFLGCAPAAGAAGPPAPAPAAAGSPAAEQLADLAWLAGTWTGELDGTIEEQWSGAAAGAMMGMFRWVRGERVLVYEFLLLESTPEGLVLRLRHFGPGLIGWEDKDKPLTLRRVAAGPGEAAFEGGEPGSPLRLVYRRTGERTMTVDLELTRDGKKSLQQFLYTR